jgi:hypothetical protein
MTRTRVLIVLVIVALIFVAFAAQAFLYVPLSIEQLQATMTAQN